MHGARLRALADRARAGGDTDLVHDVRVALRRLEALARLFRDVPGRGDGEPARAAARELRRRLSRLRSEEVGRALLAERAGEAGEGLEALAFPGALPAVRVEDADVVKVALAASGWGRRLAAAFEGPFAPRAAGESTVRRRTRRRVRQLLDELASLLPPRRKTLHDARIAAKRVRYALEILEPLDPDVPALLRLLRAFQEVAGDVHDLAELSVRVREAVSAAADVPPAADAVAAGLEADLETQLEVARRQGRALGRAVRRFRPALGTAETR